MLGLSFHIHTRGEKFFLFGHYLGSRVRSEGLGHLFPEFSQTHKFLESCLMPMLMLMGSCYPNLQLAICVWHKIRPSINLSPCPTWPGKLCTLASHMKYNVRRHLATYLALPGALRAGRGVLKTQVIPQQDGRGPV